VKLFDEVYFEYHAYITKIEKRPTRLNALRLFVSFGEAAA